VLNDYEEIQANQNSLVDCKTSPIQEGGLYNISISSVPGNARKYDSLTSLTADGKKPYHFRVVPTIESVSANNGSLAG